MTASLQEDKCGARVLDSPKPAANCGDVLQEDRRWAEAALAGEKRVLEMIAGGHALTLILEALCRVVEAICQGSFCSIGLLDAKGERIYIGAAPSFPKSYFDAFKDREIACCWGPCGT